MAGRSILSRIAEGDSEAVAECLDRYGGLVWSLARRLSGSNADAEDAVQEIFLQIWRSSGRYDPSIASESTFIAMIARRRLIDRLRRSKRDTASSLENFDTESPVDLSRDFELSDEASKALKHLRELPADQTKVISLAIYHGMSHSKIAAATGMPLGTVKTNIRRGLLRLRDVLGSKTA